MKPFLFGEDGYLTPGWESNLHSYKAFNITTSPGSKWWLGFSLPIVCERSAAEDLHMQEARTEQLLLQSP